MQPDRCQSCPYLGEVPQRDAIAAVSHPRNRELVFCVVVVNELGKGNSLVFAVADNDVLAKLRQSIAHFNPFAFHGNTFAQRARLPLGFLCISLAEPRGLQLTVPIHRHAASALAALVDPFAEEVAASEANYSDVSPPLVRRNRRLHSSPRVHSTSRNRNDRPSLTITGTYPHR